MTRGALYRYPLSVTLSAALLAGSLLVMAAYVLTLWSAQRDAILRDSTQALTSEITRTQRYLQHFLNLGNVAQVQEELGALGTDTRVRLALLTDSSGRIVASVRRVDLDQPLTRAVNTAGIDAGDPAVASVLDEVRTRRGARTLALHDAGLLLAAAPLEMPPTEGRLGQAEQGLLLLGWDMTALYSQALANTLAITQRFLPMLGAAVLAFWVLLHFMLGKRLRRLTDTTERITHGRLDERSDIDGQDEIGRLSHAFNRMTDALVAQQQRITQSEQRLSLSQTYSNIGSWEWDIATGEFVWTDNVYHLLGEQPGASVTFGRFLELIHPDDRDRLQDALKATLEHGAPYHVEVRTASGNSAAKWVMSRGDVLRDTDGRPMRMYGIVQDITKRKLAEAALFDEKERALVTLASIGDGVITTDTRGVVTFLNPVAEYMTGWKNEQAKHRDLKEIFHIVNELTRRPAPDPVERCLRDGRIVGLANHTVLVRPDGREFAIEDSAAPIRNREGETIGVVLVFHDVTKAREMANRLSWQASHDSLTGLYNRVAFEERIRQLVRYPQSPTGRETHTLLYIDLDQFKVVNDVAGHIAGDEVLKQVSGLMQHQVRESDMLARLGGDEFGLVLTQCDIDHAQRVADAIHTALEGFKFTWDDRVFRVGASIGVLEFRPGEASLTDLLRAADLACYAAKNAGRRRTHVYQIDDVHTQRHRTEMDWATRLNDAVEGDRLVLYGQIVRPLKDEATPGGLHFEVLVRMREDDGTLVMPGVFLPAAERFDLMSIVDRWIITRAFSMVAECRRAEGNQRIAQCALNLSGATLGDESLLPFIKSQLALHDVPPELFCFEITETAAISNFQAAIRFIRELRTMGCRFALDDFGSGLSSFSYLKNLPVDYLKIDGTFVRGMSHDPVNRTLVGNINDIGHLLGKQTIAEYAEDEATIVLLGELGVDYAQGYGISRPQPLEEILAAHCH